MRYGGVVEVVAESANVDRKTAKAVLDALAREVPAWLLGGLPGDARMPIPGLGAFYRASGRRSIVPGKGEVVGGPRVAFRAFQGGRKS